MVDMLPPVGGPTAPPFADPLPGIDNFTLPMEVQQEFVRGLMEGMRLEMESWAHATGEMEGNLDGIVEASRMLKDEATGAVREIRELQMSEDSQRAAIAQMESMGLSPEVIAGVVRMLAEHQGLPPVRRDRQESSGQTGLELPEEFIEGVKEGVQEGVEGALDRQRSPSTPASTAAPSGPPDAAGRDPFSDVVDSGDVPRGSRPRVPGVPEGRSREAAVPSSADDFMSYEEGVRLGGDFGSLRERAAGGINRWATSRLESQRPEMLPTGEWASPRRGHQFEQAQNRLGRATGMIQDVAGASSVAGALGSISTSLARVLGPIGMAVGGFQMAGDFLGNQRAANMPYQSVFGGGQADAYGQRLQETLFSRFDAFGTLSPGEAARLFRNVSQLGMEGEERDRATDFALDLYRQGVGLDSSMALITVAADEGEGALEEMRLSMQALAETAEESGVSIKVAHQHYIDAIKDASNITVGEGSDRLASAVANIQTRQENTGLGEIDYMSLFQSTTAQALAAQQLGVTRADISTGVQSGDPAILDAIVQANLGEGGLMGHIGSVDSDTQMEIDRIFENSGGTLSAEDAQKVSSLLENAGAFDSAALPALARTFGIPGASEQQMRHIIARQYVGDPAMDIPTMLTEAEEKREHVAITTWDDGDALIPSQQGGGPNWFGGNQRTAQQQRAEWGWRDSGWTWIGGEYFDAENVRASADKYFEEIYSGERTQRSPSVEDFYRAIGRQSEDEDLEAVRERAQMFNDATFEVLGEGGEVEETFGIADLVSHADALETGRVRMIGADGKAVPIEQHVPGITRLETPTSQDFSTLSGLLDALNQTLINEGITLNVETKGDLADLIEVKHDGGSQVKGAKNDGTVLSGFQSGIELFNRGG